MKVVALPSAVAPSAPAPLPLDLAWRSSVARDLLGEIHWQTEVLGYCRCPGEELHTHKRSSRRECRVMLDGAPTVYCAHQSCAAEVARLNREFRSQIAKGERPGQASPLSQDEMREREAQRRVREARANAGREAQCRAARALQRILTCYAWPECDVWEASPSRLEGAVPGDGARFLAALYRPADLLWIGDVHDSGTPAHRGHFRSAADWLVSTELADGLAGPLIGPATFQAGSYSRAEVNLEARPFIVLEGDSADPECAAKQQRGESLTDRDRARNRQACLAVLNFLRLETDLTLRAVVDSGSKSAHGWFDTPDAALLAELRLLLPSLGFDPATLRPAQPVRLPGVLRPGSNRWQRLLYLHPPTLPPNP